MTARKVSAAATAVAKVAGGMQHLTEWQLHVPSMSNDAAQLIHADKHILRVVASVRVLSPCKCHLAI
jgi:hypothetical protein